MKTATWLWLMVILALHLLFQYFLHRTGFIALTADEFGRLAYAASWAQHPAPIWAGFWLPFYTYLSGGIVLLNLPWWSSSVLLSVLIGLVLIFASFRLAEALFGRTTIALFTAFLVAISPVYVWLSTVPLTEIFVITLIVCFAIAFIRYTQTQQARFALVAALFLALASGFRYEAWIISLFFSLYVGLCYWKFGGAKRYLLICLALPWIFPLLWSVGNYLIHGNALYYFTFTKQYEIAFYGNNQNGWSYFKIFFAIDPYVACMGIVAVVFCLVYRRGEPVITLYTLLTVLPLGAFFAVQGGLVVPQGQMIRRMSIFFILIYPLAAFLSAQLLSVLVRAKALARIVMGLLAGILLLNQISSTLEVTNDPAANGLAVGQWIKDDAHTTTGGIIVVERLYWEYLAIRIGTEDQTNLAFDRIDDYTQRDAPSIFRTTPVTMLACLRQHHVELVAAKSADIQQRFEGELALVPMSSINGYKFYHLDYQGAAEAATPSGCPTELAK